MKKQIILWLAAIVITFLSGYLESVTDEYYPITGTIGIEGEKVSFLFEKIHKKKNDFKILIRTEKPGITGILSWKKKNDKNRNEILLKNEGNNLTASIPVQEALTKIQYKVRLKYGAEYYDLPGPVKLTFFGEVPKSISFLYYVSLLGGLLLAIRAGLEYFNEKPKIGLYTIFTLIFFFVFTIAVNPLKLSFEFGAINNIVLPITDLFPLKGILLFLLWIAGLVVVFSKKISRKSIIFFSAATILIYILVD